VIGFYLNNPDTLFGYLHLVITLTNLNTGTKQKYVSTKASVFRERSSAPRYLQLRQVLLNQLNFVESCLRSDFRMRNEPLHVEKLMQSHLPTVGSSCSQQSIQKIEFKYYPR